MGYKRSAPAPHLGHSIGPGSPQYSGGNSVISQHISRTRTSIGLPGAACTALFGAAACSSPEAAVVSEDSQVQGGAYRLHVTINMGERLSERPVLLVALHGDLGTGYEDRFASQAASGRDVVGVGLLRPGYRNRKGNTSDGERGFTTGDNYNARNTDAIAAAIAELKRKYHPRKTVLAGHSGGAAIVANIVGRHPDVADEALLIACPCDVDAWREHMLRRNKFEGFRGKIDTLSPIDQLTGVRVPVTLIAGTKDDVAPPDLSERYRDTGVKLGKNIRLVKLDGKDHEIFLDQEVFAVLAPMLD
jgi:pimeloyl-ACP methyl ester carboxylesterase